MGPVAAVMAFHPTGARVTLEGRFHHPPANIVIRIPYFVTLHSFTSNARESRVKDRTVVLSPDVTRADLTWQVNDQANAGTFEELLRSYRGETTFSGTQIPDPPSRPAWVLDSEKRAGPAPLSFDLVLAAFRHEYGRRYAEFIKAGGKPTQVAAPAMLTADERRLSFAGQFGRQLVANAATGCTVEASASLPNHGPEKAVDGIVSLDSSWQADPYPQWLQLDLGKPTTLKGMHLWPYWGGGRYYRYTVAASHDRQNWTTVGDKSANTQPASEKGDRFEFAPREVRYLRVNMLYHSLNPGVHLVEIAPEAASP
jgi:hypothetical protein